MAQRGRPKKQLNIEKLEGFLNETSTLQLSDIEGVEHQIESWKKFILTLMEIFGPVQGAKFFDTTKSNVSYLLSGERNLTSEFTIQFAKKIVEKKSILKELVDEREQ
ncbi:MAG: hypothetical protein GY754_43005 [bacterium]|nr:hypothetical protein [bacterium]